MMFNQIERFSATLDEQQKELERLAIQTLITAKTSKIKQLKQSSEAELVELADAMFDQTAQVLPKALEGAFQGKTVQAAKQYLCDIKRPELKTAVRG